MVYCMPYCASPCAKIFGDAHTNCGACNMVDKSAIGDLKLKCFPGATGWPKMKGDDTTQHHTKMDFKKDCEIYCKDGPCSMVEGMPHVECGACPSTGWCHPGAEDFPTCNPWCEDSECSSIDGDVKKECGACGYPFKCRHGEPGFPAATTWDDLKGEAETWEEAQSRLADHYGVNLKQEM